MPYYVYAIHTDNTGNRLCEKFDDFRAAEKLEREMKDGQIPTDNYFVKMFYADNNADAESKADALRPFPKKNNKQ
jgi:hypothetical protein